MIDKVLIEPTNMNLLLIIPEGIRALKVAPMKDFSKRKNHNTMKKAIMQKISNTSKVRCLFRIKTHAQAVKVLQHDL